MTAAGDIGALSQMPPKGLAGLLTAQCSKVKPDIKPGQSRLERPERGTK
jgi:hypothetical protein